jgi:hypothetical protein
VVITAMVSALVAAGAFAAAAVWRERTTASEEASPGPASTSGAGLDGCMVPRCTVLRSTSVAGTTVDLVADRDATSGRLRIGGAGSSEVFEVTITTMGAVLGPESLQCLPGLPSACLVRGQFPQGVIGEVVVGRSTKWNELAQPFQSDAGYLALADVNGDNSADVLVAQHRCDRTVTPDCANTQVFVRVYDMQSQDLGCTRNYSRLESLPGWPTVTLTAAALDPCT